MKFVLNMTKFTIISSFLSSVVLAVVPLGRVMIETIFRYKLQWTRSALILEIFLSQLSAEK